MVGRKPKYSCPRSFTGYVDEKDLEYLDDHRGKMARMAFLIECMYAIKTDHDRIKTTQEQISRYQHEIHELKKKLLFAESTIERLSKKAPTATIDIEAERERIFRKYEPSLISMIQKGKGKNIEWGNMFKQDRNSDYFDSVTDIRNYCMARLELKEMNQKNKPEVIVI